MQASSFLQIIVAEIGKGDAEAAGLALGYALMRPVRFDSPCAG